jgi:Flp pilus assembly protein TadD
MILALLGQNPGGLVHQAQEDFNAGRYASAEEELTRAVKSEPRNWSLWFYLGATRARLKKIGPAIAAFEEARSLAPLSAPIDFNLGLLYMGRDADRALDRYREGLALDPNDAGANQNYALLLMRKGKFGEAVDPLERLKRMNGGDLSTRVSLIEAYLKCGKKSEGESEIEDLLKVPGIGPREELQVAKTLIADREAPAAEQILKQVALAWPTSAEAHGELGILLIYSQQYEAAVNELGRAVQLDPDSAKYSLGLGEALLRWRHDPIALQFLQAVQEKFGDNPVFKFELALAYFNLNRYPQAIPEFEELARLRPDSGKVQYYLGGCYQAMGDLDKAKECYRRAIKFDPQAAPYYTALAELLKKEEPTKLKEPVHLLEQALALNPEDTESKMLLASCREREGNLEEAQALLEQVIKSEPDSRRAHTALAQVYYREKKVEEAKQEEGIAAKLQADKMKKISPWGPGESMSP